jgi:hypothetical protein
LPLVGDDGSSLSPTYQCLGQADLNAATRNNNPNRDSTRPYGNTPSGQYAIPGFQGSPTDAKGLRSYGPNGMIVLDPTGGDALTAKQNGGAADY